jgi:hypothetical protein
MSNDDVPVGRLISIIIAVLAAALVLSLAGLVVLGIAGDDSNAGETLAHVIETVVGVFIGIAAGRLADE